MPISIPIPPPVSVVPAATAIVIAILRHSRSVEHACGANQQGSHQTSSSHNLSYSIPIHCY
jgi:hypothetical protein